MDESASKDACEPQGRADEAVDPGHADAPAVGLQAGTGSGSLHASFGRCLLSASTSSAFGDVIEAHNRLVQRLATMQEQMDTLLEAQTHLSQGMNRLGSHQEAQKAEIQQSLEEVRTQSREAVDGLKQRLDQQGKALEDGPLQQCHDRSHKILDVESIMNPKVSSLERALEDLATANADMASKTLPRWRQDVSTELQKVAAQLEAQRECSRQDAAEQHAQAAGQMASLQEQLTALVRRAADEGQAIGEAVKRLETRIDGLATRLESSERRLGLGESGFQEHLREQEQRLGLLDGQAEQAKQEGQALALALAKLEAVVKQAEYERLGSAERAARELDSRLSEEESARQAALERMRQELPSCEEVHGLQTRLQAAEASGQSVVSRIEKTEKQVTGDFVALQQKLQEESQALSEQYQAEAARIFEKMACEGIRVDGLERSLQESAARLGQKQEAASQDMRLELQATRSDMEASLKSVALKSEATDLACQARMAPVQDAVDLLTKELHGFLQLQAEKESDSSHLEVAVRELQARLRPWRVGLRSTMPLVHTAEEPASGVGGKSPCLAATANAITMPSPVVPTSPRPPGQRPASAGQRPASAGQRRGDPRGVALAPAAARPQGAGFVAARSKATPTDAKAATAPAT